MVGRILIELETPNDSRSMFRLIVDEAVVGETLTAAQTHILVGEILDRITIPRRAKDGPRQQQVLSPRFPAEAPTRPWRRRLRLGLRNIWGARPSS